MTIRRTLSWTIPGTPAEIVRRLGDPAVARARVEAEPALHAEVTELATDTPDGAALVMAVSAGIPQGWVPARVAANLPGQPRIVRREVWRLHDDGTAAADMTVGVEALPATTMAASAGLEPMDATRSTLTYEVQLSVAIPLVGAVVERAVIEQICRGYEKEAAVIRGS
ncbi:MAG: DUF2505 domain-containing protein [Austwickia sp.]|jgi:hypothetical protein|nr:MAG: DUF2505 domain-containing protein [Austwickia sp.]